MLDQLSNEPSPQGHEAAQLINSELNRAINLPSNTEAILCNHCKRTASNGVRCLGMCVADNDY